MKQMIVLVALSLISLIDAKNVPRSEGEDDYERLLGNMIEQSDEIQSNICETKTLKIRCYKDSGRGAKKVLNELLFTDRDLSSPKSSGKVVDWFNFEVYLKDLVCRCAKAAKAKGYTHFGLQYYGECFSSPDASRVYASRGVSKACVNQNYGECDARDTSQVCVGGRNANFVYMIPDVGSGSGDEVVRSL